ncbi:MAG: ribonuclease III, partial [Francisellaceae bacterium]|nr:ribonuclease III [Francisellaceae bacterium]
GYEFADTQNLILALSHKSIGAKNNERLEFFGDSILSYVIAEILLETFPKANEGQLTRMRAHLVCKDTLTIVAKELEIDKHIILSNSETRTGGHQRSSILADALEAVMAAIHRDSSIGDIKRIIKQWFFSHIEKLKESDRCKDSKTQLQEYLQSFGEELPKYNVVRTTGPAHQQIFHVECKLGNSKIKFIGVADGRRKAEQMAAEEAYIYLKESKQKK